MFFHFFHSSNNLVHINKNVLQKSKLHFVCFKKHFEVHSKLNFYDLSKSAIKIESSKFEILLNSPAAILNKGDDYFIIGKYMNTQP